jgi:hypothetical protein
LLAVPLISRPHSCNHKTQRTIAQYFVADNKSLGCRLEEVQSLTPDWQLLLAGEYFFVKLMLGNYLINLW